MKPRHLAILLAGCLAAACSGSDEQPGAAPRVTIHHDAPSGLVAIGQTLALHARVTNGVDARIDWTINGQAAGNDSLLLFQGKTEGPHAVQATAWNDAGENTDSATLRVVPGFGMQTLRQWAGEGDNRAALAVQWTNAAPPDTLFLAWGFQWPAGQQHAATRATGIDMIKAVAAADPRLFILVRESPLGTLLLGIGYDGNDDGHLELRATTTAGQNTPRATGTPLSLTEKDFPGGLHDAATSGIDPDNLTATSDGDWWMSGWQANYLTYWNHEGEWLTSDDDFTYAPLGASLRLLRHGSWDAWTLSPVTDAETNTRPRLSRLQPAP